MFGLRHSTSLSIPFRILRVFGKGRKERIVYFFQFFFRILLDEIRAAIKEKRVAFNSF